MRCVALTAIRRFKSVSVVEFQAAVCEEIRIGGVGMSVGFYLCRHGIRRMFAVACETLLLVSIKGQFHFECLSKAAPRVQLAKRRNRCVLIRYRMFFDQCGSIYITDG